MNSGTPMSMILEITSSQTDASAKANICSQALHSPKSGVSVSIPSRSRPTM